MHHSRHISNINTTHKHKHFQYYKADPAFNNNGAFVHFITNNTTDLSKVNKKITSQTGHDSKKMLKK